MNAVRELENQRALLQDAFDREFGSGKIRVHSAPISFRTSRQNVHYVQIGRSLQPAKVVKFEDKLNEMLAWSLNTRVNIQQGPPMLVFIDRTDEVRIPIQPVLQAGARKGQGRPILLAGEGYDFTKTRFGPGETRNLIPQVIDLSRSESPHLMVGGVTGAGKTKLIQGMIAGLTVMSSPEDVSLAIIDPKGKDFRRLFPFANESGNGSPGLPHLCHGLLPTPEERIAAMAKLLQEMERRAALSANLPPHLTPEEESRALGPYIVIVIDEIADLVMSDTSKKVAGYIRRIAQMGRGLKMHLVLGTQKPTNSFVQEVGQDKANIPIRIAGKTTNLEEGKYITGLKGSELRTDLLRKGDFMLVGAGQPQRVHAFWLEDTDLLPAVHGVAQLWQGQRSRFQLPDLSTEVAHTKAKASRPKSRKGRKRSDADVEARHRQMVEAAAEAMRQGKPLTPTSIVKAHQKKWSMGLNYNTAQAIYERAERLAKS